MWSLEEKRDKTHRLYLPAIFGNLIYSLKSHQCTISSTKVSRFTEPRFILVHRILKFWTIETCAFEAAILFFLRSNNMIHCFNKNKEQFLLFLVIYEIFFTKMFKTIAFRPRLWVFRPTSIKFTPCIPAKKTTSIFHRHLHVFFSVLTSIKKLQLEFRNDFCITIRPFDDRINENCITTFDICEQIRVRARLRIEKLHSKNNERA